MYAVVWFAEGGNIYAFLLVVMLVVGWGTWVTKRARVTPRMSNRKMITELYKAFVGEKATEFKARRVGVLERIGKVEDKLDIEYGDDEIVDGKSNDR